MTLDQKIKNKKVSLHIQSACNEVNCEYWYKIMKVNGCKIIFFLIQFGICD